MLTRRNTLVAAAGVLPSLASAQGTGPTQPVTMVVPFVPGGAPDVAARILAPRMAEALGRPVMVENRAGAGSTLGTKSVIQAAPDGSTILVGSISIVTAPLIMQPAPYDSSASLRAVSHIGTTPYVLVVRADAKPRDIRGFHAWVAENREKLSYGSSGTGSPLHLGGAMYNVMLGADLNHVPYRGSTPALTDLVAGKVDMVFADLPGATPYIKEGKLRPLASLASGRLRPFPELPTMAESDPRLAGYDVYTWILVAVPKATSDALVDRYHTAVSAAVSRPEVTKSLQDAGFDLILSSPQQGDVFLAGEQKKWGEFIQKSGIKADS